MSRPAFLSDNATRIAVAFARQAARARGAALCSACVDVLAVSGVGISVMAADETQQLCASNSMVAALEEVQFTTGEGPCRDAFRQRRVVMTPIFDRAASTRWPEFIGLAAERGVSAVFAYPLGAYGANIGVLSVYQHQSGDLSLTQGSDTLALTSVVTETILGLRYGDVPDNALDDAVAYRAELYQASGMVAVQLRIPASEAMLRIRAHAFASGKTLGTVAAAIVARSLRLDGDRPHTPKGGADQ